MAVQDDISVLFQREVGERIKKKRQARNLSLEELGLEIGLTRMQVHRIENGYNITLKTILKLSIALDVKPENLLKIQRRFKKEDLDRLVNGGKNIR